MKEKLTQFWRRNEFFIFSLGVMGCFIYLLRGGMTSLVYLLFPLSSFFFATFWYSFHDHLTQSNYHTPRFSLNPLGNILVKARWSIMMTFTQFLILIVFFFDIQKNASVIDYYKQMYSILLVLLQFVGIIAIYINSRSDAQLDIHLAVNNPLGSKESREADLHIKVRTRLSTVFLYSQIIVLALLCLIFIIITLSRPYEGEIDSGYAIQEFILLTTSGTSVTLRFSYFFMVLFVIGVLSMLVSIGYGFYLYTHLDLPTIRQVLQEKGFYGADWMVSFIESVIHRNPDKKVLTAIQKEQIMNEIARS